MVWSMAGYFADLIRLNLNDSANYEFWKSDNYVDFSDDYFSDNHVDFSPPQKRFSLRRASYVASGKQVT